MRSALLVALALLAACRGEEPLPPARTLAGKCDSAEDEKRWVRSMMDESYLWYADIPEVDPARYEEPEAYFHALRVLTPTDSFRPRDRFSFTYPTDAWHALMESATSVGYGVTWHFGVFPDLFVAYVDGNAPAAANVQRGDRVVSINGLPLAAFDTRLLQNALLPTSPGVTVELELVRNGGDTHTATLVSQALTLAPVPLDRVIDLGDAQVGYLLFNAHTESSETPLIDAFTRLAAAEVDDLVLDVRYNPGGEAVIASEVA